MIRRFFVGIFLAIGLFIAPSFLGAADVEKANVNQDYKSKSIPELFSALYESTGINAMISPVEGLEMHGVVISKFVEFTGGAVIEAIDDEDGWTGADLSDDGIEPIQDTPAPKAPANTPKVKL